MSRLRRPAKKASTFEQLAIGKGLERGIWVATQPHEIRRNLEQIPTQIQQRSGDGGISRTPKMAAALNCSCWRITATWALLALRHSAGSLQPAIVAERERLVEAL